MKTKIADPFDIRYPIILSGMSCCFGDSRGLAAAISLCAQAIAMGTPFMDTR